MEKKSECEIVEDLLLSYVDDVLNPESKKLVDKHLIECKKCQEKLREIKLDGEEDQEKQKDQIDYLKKVRRRNTIKSFFLSILMVGLILGGVLIGIYCYKFSVLSGVANKIEKQFEGENFYIESIGTLGTEGEIGISKVWYREGKYKCVSYVEKDEEVIQTFETRYGNLKENAKEEYFVNSEEKKIRKEKLLYAKDKYDFIAIKNPIFLSNLLHYQTFRLGAPFYAKISTDHEVIGRKYYIFELEHGKQWVNMETGLPIMTFGYVSNTDYYKDTKIPLRQAEEISEYHYEFGKVTEEDVEMPNFDEYELVELNWEEETNQLLGK